METTDEKPDNCYQYTYYICHRCLLLSISIRKFANICTEKCVHHCKLYIHESKTELVHFCCFRNEDVALHTDNDRHYTLCIMEQMSAYNSTASLTRQKTDITEILFIKEREHKMITGQQVQVDECLMSDEHSPLLRVLTAHAFIKPMTDLPTDTVKVISCLTNYNQSAKRPQNKRHIYLVNIISIDKNQREKHNRAFESHLGKTADSKINLCKTSDSKIKLLKVMSAVTDKSYLRENVSTEHKLFGYQNPLQMKHMANSALLPFEIKSFKIFLSDFCHDNDFDESLDSKLQNVFKTLVSDNINNATINKTRINEYCENKKQRQLHSCLKKIKSCVKKIHVALPSLFWKVLFMLSLLTAISCQDVTVTWNMKSNMTIFGKTAVLECAISDYTNSCNGNLRQWYGGKPYDFLCRDGDCRNNVKYFERKEAMCKYTLTIYDFSEKDVNCEYTCSYGVHRSRKMLKLDGQLFTYVPSMNEVNYTVEVQTTVNATVFIPTVYPSPSCQAFYGDSKISTITNTSSVGYFFATEIQIIYKPPVDKCKGVLNISCIIGSTYFTPVYQNVTVCKGETDFNRHSEVSTVTAIVIVILIILVATLMSFLFRKNLEFGRNIRDECKSEYIPANTINQ